MKIDEEEVRSKQKRPNQATQRYEQIESSKWSSSNLQKEMRT